MPVLWTICLAIATLAFTAAGPLAKADQSRTVRVIEITKENAERSAAAIAAAPSPFIGMPPQGRVVGRAPDWRNARAESPDKNDAEVARPDYTVTLSETEPDLARVQVIKPGKAGLVVETHFVPRSRSLR